MVDPGETFAEAAVRETIEEAGILVTLKGILRVEHTVKG
jgi:phosphatase NudJ